MGAGVPGYRRMQTIYRREAVSLLNATSSNGWEMKGFKNQTINQMIGKLAFSLILVLSLTGASAQGTIMTPGKGEVQVMPDVVSFTVYISAKAPTAEGAVTSLDKAISLLSNYWTTVLNQTLSQIMTVDMQLTSANSWSYTNPNKNPVLSHMYSALKAFFVSIPSITTFLLRGVITPQVTLDAMITYSVTNVTFTKMMIEDQLKKARMMSYMDSLSHATSFAMASNQTIVNVQDVKSIEEHGKIYYPNFNGLSIKLDQPNITLESVKVYSCVEVTWGSKPN